MATSEKLIQKTIKPKIIPISINQICYNYYGNYVIEMRVDFEKQEMVYAVNVIDQGIAFRNIQLAT